MALIDIANPFPGHAETVVIASGASLSAEIDCRGRVLAEIQMPATWTAANLTFQYATAAGGSYANMYDPAGTEYTVVAAAASGITMALAAFAGKPFLKIRSGTAGAAVAQGADRTLTLVFREAS